jgi:biopolymer transport protein ExbB/TolQ
MKSLLKTLAHNKFILIPVIVYSTAARIFFEFGMVIGAFFVVSLHTALILLSLLILWQLVSWITLARYNEESKKKVTIHFNSAKDAEEFEEKLSHIKYLFNSKRNGVSTIEDIKESLDKSKLILNG